MFNLTNHFNIKNIKQNSKYIITNKFLALKTK